jgi:hypothetical protein
LQNAAAVIEHFTGVLSGFDLDLSAFRDTPCKVAIEADDLFYRSEEVTVRARPSLEAAQLHISLSGSATSPILRQVMQRDSLSGWHTARFGNLERGVYRVAVTGSGVSPAEDSFVVADEEPV